MRVEQVDDSDEDVEGDADTEYVAEEDDREAVIPCPYCKEKIHEDAQRCEHCGQYVSEEDAPVRRPWWLVLGAILCLYAVYRWIAG